jgi:hypothetical protein
MKAKTIRHAVDVGLFVFLALTTWGFAGTANAQTSPAAKFNLPFEVHWGKNVLPPGQYTVSLDPSARTVRVQSTSGTAFYTSIPIKDDSQGRKGNTAMVIMVRGNERTVRSLNFPGRGYSLIYQPATKAEREILAKADQLETVPLITAGK